MSTSIYSNTNEQLCQIYRITNQVNGKFYIGFTKRTTEGRFKNHCNIADASGETRRPLIKALRKYGAGNFIVETIYYGTDADHTLNVMEPYFIADLKPEYNVTKGGEGALGLKHSGESRNRLRLRALGRVASAETRLKLSIAATGRQKTDETRHKLSIAQLGKPKSPEHIAKIVATKERHYEITTPLGEVINIVNLTRFCRENGLDQGAMSRLKRLEVSSHKGYIGCRRLD